MQVKIIAYNELGYRMEIACLDEQQVRMKAGGIIDFDMRSFTQKTRSGIGLDPSEFPEAVKFDIIIED